MLSPLSPLGPVIRIGSSRKLSLGSAAMSSGSDEELLSNPASSKLRIKKFVLFESKKLSDLMLYKTRKSLSVVFSPVVKLPEKLLA